MWEYQIGGYQVLEKYLKDRKSRCHRPHGGDSESS
ncbi:hypothetical protein [uncultured Thermosynechococcus sp.]